MCMISVILPLYNGIKYISESIESIQSQIFTDWEFIIVNEYGSDDGCAEVVCEYAKHDKRIKLIQNTKRLGLAESLNVGISYATGKYIARVDADDPSYPERFAKQVEYLESHPDVFMCGTLQRSVTPKRSYTLEVPCDSEELKAAMLFGCEISHCSVMFRRETWIENGWKYDKDSLCEDYDLWTKIMFTHRIVNLPKVLVDHRWGFGNISIAKGEALHKASRNVSIRTLQNFGITIDEADAFLVAGWRNEPRKYAKMNPSYFLRKNYEFLSELESRNNTLHLIDETALSKILWKRWNWVCNCIGLFFREFSFDEIRHEHEEIMVSVILPVYEAVHTIRETIDSILLQTFSAWELIVVCEDENWDGSTEIAQYYAKLDKRIKVICNDTKKGLAESLNIGIRQAKGKYIARIDADDLANAARLQTQVSYMENHPEAGITQLYQHYFGTGANNFIHRPPVEYEELKARLLFFCDACHSTVMLSKSVVEQYGLYYDSTHALEDYELWCRAVRVTRFVTIPEVYGEYRVGGNNISSEKEKNIQSDMCEIVANQLHLNLNMDIADEDICLLGGWDNIFYSMTEEERGSALLRLQQLLFEIWKANEKCHFYNSKELLKAIAAKWRWSKYNISWHQDVGSVSSIRFVLELKQPKILWQQVLKNFLKKPLNMLQSWNFHAEAKCIEHLSNVTKDVSNNQSQQLEQRVKWWTWERYTRIEKKLDVLEQQNMQLLQAISEMKFQENKIPYISGEKIRIAFLYQIASFWPSWESFYWSCINNDQMDVRILFLDETNTEKSQMKGAEQFLIERNIPYIRFEESCLEEFMPHVLVIQTPYDEWHRINEHWSHRFKQMGYRVVYIPYGVEISDTEDSHQLHFKTNVIENCWRIYTFSDRMKMDYYKYCGNRNAIRALGLPRFDYYYNKLEKKLPEYVERIRKGRKLVVWKVHFPKFIDVNGRKVTVTPQLEEYVAFAKRLKEFKEYFFIFIPHPKFFDYKGNESADCIQKIMEYLSGCENVWIDYSDDYRQSLSCADYVIIDRSAVMVEAGALHIPVCYVSNAEYYEPVTKAIEPLIDSYYQANDCAGMINFLKQCAKNQDVNKAARECAFAECIPYYDGKCGERIMGDIINGIINDKS